MDNQYKKNRITIIVIFAMSIVPFGFAWFLAKNPEIVKLGTNNGALITPPQVTSADEFSGYDTFSAQNMQELKGHWVLVNPVPKNCEEACRDALYKTNQLTLMMGKDIARIRRLAVLFDKTYQLPAEWRDDGRLLKALPAASLQEKLKQLSARPLPEGMLIIMDPLGNLMMQYAPGYDPYQVKSDLNKLLRISQIG
ncbi:MULTISPECIES: hypothetical protein [Methylomonas]|uniref:Thioredoxin domain-containing protein n=3 Tax=Methylomonas TaxID=416 RepID=A0A140E3H4_9GAMM|nr:MULTISPECIES: hypothetical protein [Methylomonas]AMK74948.1 hypothetical protein JT25_000345 [Methylomonas denitrificans]OAI05810.1 hypothetical protein A1342_03380 [Methylomonas methanica]TCV80981.1 hypothetical protein EDE11_11730 [Methylomonas methanica]